MLIPFLKSYRSCVALIVALVSTAAAYGSGAPSQISISSGNSQTGTVGTNTPSPFTALVRDSNGNAVANAKVDWKVMSGGGSFSMGSTYTNASGRTGNTLTLGTAAGYDTASATIHGTSAVVIFGATAASGPAVTIGLYSGNKQTGAVGSPLPNNLQVLCKDQYGNSASHTEVDWAVAGGGGSIPYYYSLTAGGIAAKSLTLGTAPGANYATATIHGTSKSYTFTATGVPGPVAALQIVGGNDQTGALHKPLANPFIVAAVDAYGNPLPGIQVNWAVSNTGDTFSTASTVTNSLGFASSTLTLGSANILHTPTAAAPGTNVTQTFTATLWVNSLVTIHSSVSANSKPLQPYFLGLSYMKTWMTVPLFNAKNLPLVTLFKNLGPGVLRLNAELPFNPIIWDENGPGQQYGTVSKADLARLAGFLKATNWKILYGVDFVNNTAAEAASEAAVASQEFGTSLLGFEIGNEPDDYSQAVYGTPPVPQLPGYTWQDFISTTPVYSGNTLLPSWPTFASAIEAAAPNAPLTGPAAGFDWFMPFAQSNQASRLSLLTRHIYQGQYTSVLTMQTLLTPDPRIAVQFPEMAQAAAAANVPGGYRVTECNTYSNPINGVTNAFGAALWTIDFLFANATYQSSGVNFHGGGSINYSPILDDGTNVVGVGPDYYAMYAYAMLGTGGQLMNIQIDPSPSTFAAYAVQETDGSTYLILNNKDPNNSFSVGIDRPGTTVRATSYLMTAASLTATSGFQLGGSPISTNGSWQPASTQSWPIIENAALVTVPASSAAVVHLQ